MVWFIGESTEVDWWFKHKSESQYNPHLSKSLVLSQHNTQLSLTTSRDFCSNVSFAARWMVLVTWYQSLPTSEPCFPHLWEGESKVSNLFQLYSSFHTTLVLQLDRWCWASHFLWTLGTTLYGDRAEGDKSLKTLPDLQSSALACSEDSGHLSHGSH